MPFDGLNGPVITAVTVGWFLAKFVVGTHFRSDLTKLDMINGHWSRSMSIDRLHGPVITAVTVG